MIFNDMKSLWNSTYWNSRNAKKNLKSRLMALNKRPGEIPSLNSYRPIIISSALLKFVESRLKPKLKEYCNTRLEKSQTGFLEKCDVQINLTRLFDLFAEDEKGNKKKTPLATVYRL